MIRKMTVWEQLHYQHEFGLGVQCLVKDYPEHIALMILKYKQDFITEDELESCLMEAGWIWEKNK